MNKSKNILIIIGTILLIGIVIVLFYIQKSNDNYNNIKIDKSKYLVYTKQENNDKEYPKSIPYINIKTNNIDIANKQIDSFVINYINKDKASISYEYNISGKYLSLVIKTEDYNTQYGPDVKFISYIINLKNKKILSDDEVLKLYNMSIDEIPGIIEHEFNNYYEDILEEGYLKKNKCSYSCFINNRGIRSYSDNLNYYIKNGDLVVYKPFIFYSKLGDGEFFSEENYEFLLKEIEK